MLTGSIEQSPRFMNQYHEYMSTEDLAIMPAETQLREDLADAMRESPRDSGEPIYNFNCVLFCFVLYCLVIGLEFRGTSINLVMIKLRNIN